MDCAETRIFHEIPSLLAEMGDARARARGFVIHGFRAAWSRDGVQSQLGARGHSFIDPPYDDDGFAVPTVTGPPVITA